MFVLAFFAPYFIQRKIDTNTKQKEMLFNKLKNLASLVKECQGYIRNTDDNNSQEHKQYIKASCTQI